MEHEQDALEKLGWRLNSDDEDGKLYFHPYEQEKTIYIHKNEVVFDEDFSLSPKYILALAEIIKEMEIK